MATSQLIDVIDSDSHLTEPPDLWTSRLPKKWQEDAPRVEVQAETGAQRWRIGDQWAGSVGGTSQAGEYILPDGPPTFDLIQPACYDADARTAWMDQYGIRAQVLYSNILAFAGHAFIALKDRDLRLACVRAYNDYLVDFGAAAPGRFILMANLPFWDPEECVREAERCAQAGHHGILWAATLDKHGLPHHTDPVWYPLYEVAQEAGLSINFHVGVGKTEAEIGVAQQKGSSFDPAFNATRSATGFLSNANTVADLITSGLCDRFPRLNFVSVESGFGYIPYLIEALDWQWVGSGGPRSYPNRLLPSEYFSRQIYATFWFETNTLRLLDLLPDNILFETDFPHATSLTPGSHSQSEAPNVITARLVDKLGEELMRKVLHDNAARLYHLD
jgi:predicted TIM-barrel fold metal-dependent hydrolase